MKKKKHVDDIKKPCSRLFLLRQVINIYYIEIPW